MISRNKAAHIISLQKKKIRNEEKLFVIEGDKIVREFLEAKVTFKTLVALPEFLNSLTLFHKQGIGEIIPATENDLKKISSLKTPHNALAVISMIEPIRDPDDLKKELTIALDCIQDPGNLGTIIRSAAWFGIKNIYCSGDCADVYNPKVIQSSMGAILHVNVTYISLPELMESARNINVKIYGALIEGESIYTYKLGSSGIILLGNESKGISGELLPFITDRIMIPKLTYEQHGIDSLNVSMAASVILSEFTRGKGRAF
jgi:TrmH family RNA methyltransferase